MSPKPHKAASTGQRLAALVAAEPETSPTFTETLAGALNDPSNRVVARAAELAAEHERSELIADLLAAYERALVDPIATDPGCLAKTAIVEALVALKYADIGFYRVGLKYEQLEAIEDWGAMVRAACAGGLASCAPVLDVLLEMADLLADPWKLARVGAARAISQLNVRDGIPLLQYKVQIGDSDHEVLGECCGALARLAPERAVAYIARWLESPNPDRCVQAAPAIAETRRPEALPPLVACFEEQRDRSVRSIVPRAVGLLRRPEANQFLVSVITRRDEHAAASAIRALATMRSSSELRREVAAAVQFTGNQNLTGVFASEFGASQT